MSKHVKHVPKHRAAPTRSTSRPLAASRGALRTSLVVSSVAVAATGATIGAGVLASSSADPASAVAEDTGRVTGSLAGAFTPPSAEDAAAAADAAVDLQARDQAVSRSADRRAAADPAKQAALAVEEEVEAVAGEQSLSDADPRDIARALMGEFGFSSDQFGCLDSLWTRESNWNVYADNPTSSAYGIPQSLPGEKMASAGPDWETNPVTQIRWGLGYIQDRYGSPCGAWGHSESVGWY